MARLQLNKSSLAKESARLKTFQQFLPTLDLKRQQLMVERSKARQQMRGLVQRIEELELKVSDKVPMLANTDVDMQDMVKVSSLRLGQENVVGTRLPTLDDITIECKAYSLLAKPHWVDTALGMLKEMLELRVRLQIDQRRLALLEKAVVTITQRLNLFDKVLIPEAKSNIKKIKVYLSDEQMAAVVRSKIAKRKRQQQGSQAGPDPEFEGARP